MTRYLAVPLELRDLAVSVAQSAGRQLLTMRQSMLVTETKSSGSDWVSNADRAAEDRLVEMLTDARPNDGILAEESTTRRSISGLTWIIDPLDGTTNYLRGYPGWSVSVAVEVDGSPLAGAVYDPSASMTYAAAADCGATLNGSALNVWGCAELASALVGTGFSYRAAQRARQAERLARLLPLVTDIRRGGSAALELCRVADGSLDAFYEDDLERWDWAAGALIVEEAGGVVERLASEAGGGVVAASAAMLPELRRVLDLDQRVTTAEVLTEPNR